MGEELRIRDGKRPVSPEGEGIMRREFSAWLALAAIMMLQASILSSSSWTSVYGSAGSFDLWPSSMPVVDWNEVSQAQTSSEFAQRDLSDPGTERGMLEYGSGRGDAVIFNPELIVDLGFQDPNLARTEESEKLVQFVAEPDGSMSIELFDASEIPIQEQRAEGVVASTELTRDQSIIVQLGDP